MFPTRTSHVNPAGATTRIAKEVAKFYPGADLSLAVVCSDQDVRDARALILGPPDTPYQNGFFEFHIVYSANYPVRETCLARRARSPAPPLPPSPPGHC